MNKKIVIYTRFSSEMQRTESCDDQERKVREALHRLGIDHQHALVIRDQAESGTTCDRAQFAVVLRMIQAGEVGLLTGRAASAFVPGRDERWPSIKPGCLFAHRRVTR